MVSATCQEALLIYIKRINMLVPGAMPEILRSQFDDKYFLFLADRLALRGGLLIRLDLLLSCSQTHRLVITGQNLRLTVLVLLGWHLFGVSHELSGVYPCVELLFGVFGEGAHVINVY